MMWRRNEIFDFVWQCFKSGARRSHNWSCNKDLRKGFLFKSSKLLNKLFMKSRIYIVNNFSANEIAFSKLVSLLHVVTLDNIKRALTNLQVSAKPYGHMRCICYWVLQNQIIKIVIQKFQEKNKIKKLTGLNPGHLITKSQTIN